METPKTHWKKNNDSRYISGEDLKSGLNGLAPEMVVYISAFQDAETFDQAQQTKLVKTGLFLSTMDGKPVYKPVILNNTNAKFLAKEFKSEYMEDWRNHPVIIYAQQDKRHGFVARFRKYIEKAQPQQTAPKPTISEGDISIMVEQFELIEDIAGLQKYWSAIGSEAQANEVIFKAKETAKNRLNDNK